ncbi:1-aminocyclopropane-1-carboxylate deaminase/D-cysteine desulfhydrase [Vibrio fluvialis]|nr:1-aminocyclopropane-1-carboxylate deaminase/D-cysteine desulfhydrase [Vibrio fluvialis]MBY8300464.1 1-aminocyclopropane-1-carboxylate deaminase/D-cysteine desulfhydrase [Vibrio fluvialis]
MKLAHSPITYHHFANLSFHLKRDDLLHPQFSGNKARKFMALFEGQYSTITTLISYGSAQANSLYSLAALARLRNWQLEFYVDHIPAWLKVKPIGNYRAAQELGARIIETRPLGEHHPRDYIAQIRQPDDSCLFVEEGGRSTIAEQGVTQLANELLAWIAQQPKQAWRVALPSGTGTTALFLHKALSEYDIEVVTCPCVGGEAYLVEQFIELGETSHPIIINASSKHHFGRLYQQDYEIWLALHNQTGVEFDLLYDPLMWRSLLEWLPTQPHKSLIYIHQGGLLGNESMLPRYRRQFGKNEQQE